MYEIPCDYCDKKFEVGSLHHCCEWGWLCPECFQILDDDCHACEIKRKEMQRESENGEI
jgi:hypothetical protein